MVADYQCVGGWKMKQSGVLASCSIGKIENLSLQLKLKVVPKLPKMRSVTRNELGTGWLARLLRKG